MIQKKSLKDAIQNPEIISVVGELIGVVSIKNSGLYPARLSGLYTSDKSIKITLSNIYGSPAFRAFLYYAGENSLADIVISSTKNIGYIRQVGNFNADVYIKDTIVYIRPRKDTNVRLDITPLSWNFDSNSILETVAHSEVDSIKSSFIKITDIK